MRCERAQELFSDYCEGSIQRALMVPLESHLADCRTCREDVACLRELWTMLDEAPIVEPPAGFRAHVLSRAETSRGSDKSFTRRFKFDWRSLVSRRAIAWVGAAAILLVLVPFVVPGRYTSAWLGSIGDLLHGRTQSVSISVGPAHPGAANLNEMVVPLMVKGADEVQATVRVVRGDADVQEQSKRITLSSKKPAEVHLRMLRPETTAVFSLELSWLENGIVQKQTIDIN